MFDPNEPGGVWECDLSNPYERVVANELVELAWSQPGENWQNETLDDKPFELREPGEHEVLTREQYKLPEEGLMSITYIQSAVMVTPPDLRRQGFALRLLEETVRHVDGLFSMRGLNNRKGNTDEIRVIAS